MVNIHHLFNTNMFLKGDMKNVTEIKVRGYHADFYGHVNNARYLEFLEENRWVHLEGALDVRKLAAKGYIFLVVNININYRKAVPVGETLLVSTDLGKIGTKSAVLKQLITNKKSGETVVDALVTFVIMGKNGGVVELEGDIRSEIEALSVATENLSVEE